MRLQAAVRLQPWFDSGRMPEGRSSDEPFR